MQLKMYKHLKREFLSSCNGSKFTSNANCSSKRLKGFGLMKIAIVGAGATGLTAGYELAKAGHFLTVYEKSSIIGGLASTFQIGGTDIEKYYHHIFTSDSELILLVNELGLSDNLKWYPPSNGIYINNKFYPFTTPFDLLMFDAVPLFQRVRLGLLILKSNKIESWNYLENITAKQWLTDKAGKAVYIKLWGPLLKSKFDVYCEKISAAWLWNKFKLRGSSRNKNGKGELLGYMDKSFGVIYDKLCRLIIDMNGQVLLNTQADEIIPGSDGSVSIRTEKCVESYDCVLFTASPGIFAGLANKHLPVDYKEKLNSIKYMANVCAVLELKESISPYYWITVAENDAPFVLMVEHTNMTGKSRYGCNIVYLSKYADALKPPYISENELIEREFIKYFNKLFPKWDSSGLINVRIFKSRYTQPVVTVGYSKIKPGFETPIRNVYTASMANIYPEDRGQNYSVKLGIEAAGFIDKHSIPVTS